MKKNTGLRDPRGYSFHHDISLCCQHDAAGGVVDQFLKSCFYIGWSVNFVCQDVLCSFCLLYSFI